MQIGIKHVRLDTNGTDFDSLIMNPTKTSVNRVAYIEKFIDAMNEPEESGGTSYFGRVHFERYVQSKSENNLVSGKGDGTEQNPKHVTWESVIEEIAKERTTGKGGGYPKRWQLKSPNR
ncbi:hypothetical protein ACE3MS_09370 [Paenibacillus dendritiformis]|uniref:hypothetical protein n=1 Tax=Paenibacillus dendritiformis TaxID=130049 RepID=UPI0036598D9E